MKDKTINKRDRIINPKSIVFFTRIIAVLSLSLGLGASSALARTRINFPKGSSCGSYSGNDNEYILGLGKGQNFIVSGNSFWSIKVEGSSGRVLKPSQINKDGDFLKDAEYLIPDTGDYIVSVSIPSEVADVEFCAY